MKLEILLQGPVPDAFHGTAIRITGTLDERDAHKYDKETGWRVLGKAQEVFGEIADFSLNDGKITFSIGDDLLHRFYLKTWETQRYSGVGAQDA